MCSVCGDTVETSTIAALGHKWGSWYTERDATCNSNGEDYKTCSVCGKSQTRTVMAGGHSWGEWNSDALDFSRDDIDFCQVSRWRECSTCGNSEEDITDNGQHQLTYTHNLISGDNIPEGSYECIATCSLCGGTDTQTHTNDDGGVEVGENCRFCGNPLTER